MKSFISSIILLFLFTIQSYGQSVKFQASAKNEVQTGERFKLVFSVNDKPQDFRYPNLNDFNVLSGPSTSSNSSVQIINGKMTQSVEYTYTFILSAKKEGVFSIPSALVKINGKEYKSNPIQVKVDKGSKKQNQQKKQYGIGEDDVYLRAYVSNDSPYIGEQVIITYKLYFKVQIKNLSNPQLSTFPGFWAKSLLDENDSYKQYDEYINGEQYAVAEIAKLALFPQKSGKINIDSHQVDAVVQVRDNSQRNNDPFFNSFFQNYKSIDLPIKSNALTLNVKQFPQKNKPVDFKNAVGKFNLESSIDLKAVKTNEPITLRYKLSGSGNIELAEIPDIHFPPDFTVYEPKVNQRINKSASGISGTKIIEYLLLPRNPGKFTIPSFEFSYFDVSKEKFVNLKSNQFEVIVEKGEGDEITNSFNSTNREDIQYLGSDIRYIMSDNQSLKQSGVCFLNSNWFYILLIFPIILFITSIIIWRNEIKKRSDLNLMRYRKATGTAKKRLKKAAVLLKDNDEKAFYEEITKALWGYISDKFSVPVSELSYETAKAALEEKQMNQEIAKELIDIIESCEYARFAPGTIDVSSNQIYDRSEKIIRNLEKDLK